MPVSGGDTIRVSAEKGSLKSAVITEIAAPAGFETTIVWFPVRPENTLPKASVVFGVNVSAAGFTAVPRIACDVEPPGLAETAIVPF